METTTKTEGLFMKKVKRPSELIDEHDAIDEMKIKKKHKSEAFNIVIVDTEQDIDRERRKQMTIQRSIRWNTHFQSIPVNLFKQNVIAVSQLASYLYLDATTVIQYCFYWLGEYNNREIASHLLFNNLIHGILHNLPILEVSGQYGLKYKLDSNSSYCLLLRFAGSDLHRVPHVHFTQRGASSNPDRENPALLKGFAYMINPLNKCFLNVYAPGMRAELQADNFIYNTILEEFFEPSFIIMTCFLLALNYQGKSFLYNLMVGKKVNKKVVRDIDFDMTQKRMDIIQTSLIVLQEFVDKNSVDDEDYREGIIEMNGVKKSKAKVVAVSQDRDCIDQNDKTGYNKRSRLVYDLVSLISIIRGNIHHLDRMYEAVALKWLEKSNYCAKEMSIRTQRMIDQL